MSSWHVIYYFFVVVDVSSHGDVMPQHYRAVLQSCLLNKNLGYETIYSVDKFVEMNYDI